MWNETAEQKAEREAGLRAFYETIERSKTAPDTIGDRAMAFLTDIFGGHHPRRANGRENGYGPQGAFLIGSEACGVAVYWIASWAKRGRDGRGYACVTVGPTDGVRRQVHVALSPFAPRLHAWRSPYSDGG